MKNNLRKAYKYPVMEFPIVAFLLAIAAGSMDGYTYFSGTAFSTVQSGNIILLGQTIATKNWNHLLTIVLTILSFGVGAMLTAIIEQKTNKTKSWSFKILWIEAIVLFLLGIPVINTHLSVLHICMVISLIAGMQGNAFHKIDGMLYGNVAVTLVVQLAFSNIISGISGVKDGFKNSGLFFFVLLGFSVGGLVGTLFTNYFGEFSLWFTAAMLLSIAFYTKIIHIENRITIDPA